MDGWPLSRGRGWAAPEDFTLTQARAGEGQTQGSGTFPSLARSRRSSILVCSIATSSLVPLSTMTSSSWKAAPHWGEQKREDGTVTTWSETALRPSLLARALLRKPPGNACFPACALAWPALEPASCWGTFLDTVSTAGLPARLVPAGAWELEFLEHSSHFLIVLGFFAHRSPQWT